MNQSRIQQWVTKGASRAMQMVSETTIPKPWRQTILQKFGDAYGVNWDEVPKPLDEYKKFADFFARPLPEGARPVAKGKNTIVSPVDGAVHSVIEIEAGQMFQVKGRKYSLQEFLGPYGEEAEQFEGGTAITIYLRPKDYHHVHAPLDCTVTEGCVVPGTLWPVNPWANQNVHNLYNKNERVGMRLTPQKGGDSLWYFMVGALFVGGIETVFCYRPTQPWHGPMRPIDVPSGGELGQFLFGSTVVMIWPKSLGVAFEVETGDELKLGQKIGTFGKAKVTKSTNKSPNSGTKNP